VHGQQSLMTMTLTSLALLRIVAVWLSRPQNDLIIAGAAAAACYLNKPEAVLVSHNKV